MSKQANPLRVHYAVRSVGGMVGPLCGHRPGAWLYTDNAGRVTCKLCARHLGLWEVKR